MTIIKPNLAKNTSNSLDSLSLNDEIIRLNTEHRDSIVAIARKLKRPSTYVYKVLRENGLLKTNKEDLLWYKEVSIPLQLSLALKKENITFGLWCTSVKVSPIQFAKALEYKLKNLPISDDLSHAVDSFTTDFPGIINKNQKMPKNQLFVSAKGAHLSSPNDEIDSSIDKNEKTADVIGQQFYDLIANSGLSVRATNILLKNFASIDEFLCFDCDSFRKIKNCGYKTIKELKTFRQDTIVDGYGQYHPEKHNLTPQQQSEDLLKFPPSKYSLDLLPIFSSKKLEYITMNDLHQGYKSSTRLSDLVISKRASNVLRRLRVTTIGELMFFPYGTLLTEQNFGRKCLKELQDIIRISVLSGNYSQSPSGSTEPGGREHPIDYSSYENLVISFIRYCLNRVRDQEIMLCRLNFPKTRPKLDQLGLQFGITRERARQIIKKGDEYLRIKANCDLLIPFFQTIRRIVTGGGGVMSICNLAASLGQEYAWPCLPNPTALAQLLAVGESEKSFAVSGELITVPCQCLACEKPRNLFLALDFEACDSYNLLVVADILARKCQNHCPVKPVKIFHRAFIEKLVDDLGETFQIHEDMVFIRKQGLIHHGKRLEDLIVRVLEMQGEPMHFSEIASVIRKENLKYQKISDHNVHAAMLRYKTIEIVKRGTYGLKAWGGGGYRPVSKAIEELLDKSGLPMRRGAIIEQLSGEFSEQNISAALHTWESRFISIGEGFYDRAEKWWQRTYSGLVSFLPELLADFAHYITSNNKFSYKPVLALVFIRGMDQKGSFYLPTLKERFYNFYLGREKKGKIIETEEAIIRRIGKFETDEIKTKACKEPLISFVNSGFFRQDGSTLHLRSSIVSMLNDHKLYDLLLIILLKEIDDYFSNIAPTTPFKNAYEEVDMRTGKDAFVDEYQSTTMVDKSEDLYIPIDDDNIIILG